jgi:AcrR family transcriptional regulator
VPRAKARPVDKREQVRERRATRRGELLTAAMDVIRRQGADATMEEMASAGGISKPILYRHFTDRDGLVRAITQMALAELGRILEKKVGEARVAGSREGVRATVDAFFEYIDSDPELYRFIVDQDTQRADSPTVAFTEGVSQLVAATIREALAAAGRDPAPAEVWGRAIVGMVSATSSWWLDDGSMSREDVVDHLADLAWFGMRPPRPAEPPKGR